ncbi:Uncharacterised protein [Mycobacteroides abscessus subsp. abscessus]|nr:Uncharacterised protein [Mycobacteroides abscessus subsp. abscessus]
MFFGLPSSARILAARSRIDRRRDCSSSSAEAIEIGKAPTRTVRKPTCTTPSLDRTPTVPREVG